jgi:hypothetical protein
MCKLKLFYMHYTIAEDYCQVCVLSQRALYCSPAFLFPKATTSFHVRGCFVSGSNCSWIALPFRAYTKAQVGIKITKHGSLRFIDFDGHII